MPVRLALIGEKSNARDTRRAAAEQLFQFLHTQLKNVRIRIPWNLKH
jgi:hypothetical protein